MAHHADAVGVDAEQLRPVAADPGIGVFQIRGDVCQLRFGREPVVHRNHREARPQIAAQLLLGEVSAVAEDQGSSVQPHDGRPNHTIRLAIHFCSDCTAARGFVDIRLTRKRRLSRCQVHRQVGELPRPGRIVSVVVNLVQAEREHESFSGVLDEAVDDWRFQTLQPPAIGLEGLKHDVSGRAIVHDANPVFRLFLPRDRFAVLRSVHFVDDGLPLVGADL